MATSSITKNFVVSGEKQVEMFANAIEESYQESLTRKQARASKGNQKAYAGIKWSHYHSF